MKSTEARWSWYEATFEVHTLMLSINWRSVSWQWPSKGHIPKIYNVPSFLTTLALGKWYICSMWNFSSPVAKLLNKGLPVAGPAMKKTHVNIQTLKLGKFGPGFFLDGRLLGNSYCWFGYQRCLEGSWQACIRAIPLLEVSCAGIHFRLPRSF